MTVLFITSENTCIRDTLNISMCADMSINTKTKKNNIRRKKNYMSCHVTCHLSATPTATARDPPLLTPPLCTEGWSTKTEPKIKFLLLLLLLSIVILALHSSTRSLQLSWFSLPLKGTHIQQTTNGHWTYRLNWPREQFSENERNINVAFDQLKCHRVCLSGCLSLWMSVYAIGCSFF